MNTVDRSKVTVYRKKDNIDIEICRRCRRNLEIGTHIVYTCDPCNIRICFCGKCMRTVHVIRITMCETEQMVNFFGRNVWEENKVGYYGLENNRLRVYTESQARIPYSITHRRDDW